MPGELSTRGRGGLGVWAAAAGIALLAVAGCKADCRDGTLFLDVTLGSARGADRLEVSVLVADATTPKTTTLSLPSGSASGGVEVTFPNGYPAGKRVHLDLSAIRSGDGAVLAQASRDFVLASGCTRLAVAFAPEMPDGGGDDAATGGSGGAGSGGSGSGGSGSGGSGGVGAGGSGGVGAGGSGGAGGSSGAGGSGGTGGSGSGGAGAGGAGDVVFEDDFEDQSTARWTLGPSNSTYSIASLGAAGTSYSLQISGGNGYFSGPNVIADFGQPRHVSFWMRVGTFGNGGTQSSGFFVISADTAALQQLIYITVTEFGPTIISTGSPFPTTPMEVNRYYHFDIDIDWQARTFTLSLDGGTPYGFNFSSASGNSAMRLDLFNSTSPSLNYWDQIEIRR